MNESYYVRIRGAVVGPFRPEQVRQLVERGKITRLHELSADRETWRPLRDFPELAVAPAASAVATPSTPSDGDTAAGQDSGQPPPVTKRQWYYDDGGQAAGPVDEAGIAALVAAGRITPTTLVWTSGMKSWEPLQQSPLSPLCAGSPAFGLHSSSEGSLGSAGSHGRGPDSKYCFHCGRIIASAAEICPGCGVRQAPAFHGANSITRGPSRVAACLLAIFLGLLGAHKFYLHQTTQGVVYLVINVLLFWTILVPVVFSIICLIEGLVYLSYTDEEFSRKYGRRVS